ncbi:MAG: radical SAM protein [Negativicutes bacterium]|nr:radical SAM protein [Negativicutes bacterium]
MKELPTALYATTEGEIFDAPGYEAVGRVGIWDAPLSLEDLIPLPPGADLMFLPDCSALAAQKGDIAPIATTLLAVAAVLPAGYTRTHLPAYRKGPETPLLPLYGYTAVAMYADKMYVAAMKSDDNAKWDPRRYNTSALTGKIDKVKKDLPGNRLVEHLARCSQQWHCCTAQNLFYQRWEAGIPVSPVCNADCLGCISLQPAECCPAPQSRIEFNPSVDEVAAVGSYHLASAPEAIISFGQGCEGEPALAAETISAAIREMRGKTGRGIINMNTNAGYTAGVKQIVDAGLDSMRVSMISARQPVHQSYYRGNYLLDAVQESILYAKSKGVYVSLNMLLLPGLNDQPEELAAWLEFLVAASVDMIQLRNLTIDPDVIWAAVPPDKPSLGVRAFVDALRQNLPQMRIGNFSRYIEKT